MRKKAGLSPHDRVILTVMVEDEGRAVLTQFMDEIVRTVGATALTFGAVEGDVVDIGGYQYVIQLHRQ
jgi:hypothetical protein